MTTDRPMGIEVTLKPCPFCGSIAKADSEESEDVGGFFVSCTRCPVSVWGIEKGEAITAWNTRQSSIASMTGDIGTELVRNEHRVRGSSAPSYCTPYGTAVKQIEQLRAAIEQALKCTPKIRYLATVPSATIVYDCGDPWEILRAALSPQSDEGEERHG